MAKRKAGPVKRAYRKNYKVAKKANPKNRANIATPKIKRSRALNTGKVSNRIPGHAAGGTFTQLRFSKQCPSYYKGQLKGLAKQTLQSCAGAAYTSTTGGQGLVSAPLAAGDKMRDIFTMAVGTEVLTTGPTQRVFLERMEMVWTIRNDTNNEVVMDIYDVTCRHDQQAANGASEPALAWALGDGNAGAANAYRTPGATPFSSPTFNQFYKVVKVHHVIMPAGSTHEHRVHVNVMRMFSNAFFSSDSGQPDMQLMKGLTRFAMLAWRGVPVAIREGGGTTISNTRLDTTIMTKYTFSIPSVSQSVVNSVNYLATTGTLSMVNDETGQVNALATAA
jgi:hypothetical protein